MASLVYEREIGGDARRTNTFGAKLEAWRQKMFHIFNFLQCDMVLGIVNPKNADDKMRMEKCG